MLFIVQIFALLQLILAEKKVYNPSLHTFEIYGGVGYGYFYMNAYVGSPPQRQALIVDTGSTTTTFPCTDCGENCGDKHLNKQFDYKKSSTYKPMKCKDKFENYVCDCSEENAKKENQCIFEQHYSEGSSYRGYYMTDKVIFGDQLFNIYENKTELETQVKNKYVDIQTDFLFGCSIQETNLFYRQEADGIIGLGPQTNSQTTQPNIIDMAFKYHNHKDEQLEFSICIGIKSGYMQIGGYDSKKHRDSSHQLVLNYYTNLVAGQYGIWLHGMKISDKNVTDRVQGIVDSGATMTYLPNQYYSFILNNIKDHCQQSDQNCLGKKNGEKCFQYNQNETNITIEQFFNSFPTIYLTFENNQTFEWPPMDYLYERNQYNFCVGISESYEISLGQSFMRFNDILFDREKQKLVITKADCGEYLFGHGEKYNPTVLEYIQDIIQESDPTVLIVIIAGGIFFLLFIIVVIVKFCCKKKQSEADEQVLVKQNQDVENNQMKNGNQQNNFQIGDNNGQNIEMAYKDIYQEKIEEDDTQKAKKQLADFQKFNFETH